CDQHPWWLQQPKAREYPSPDAGSLLVRSLKGSVASGGESDDTPPPAGVERAASLPRRAPTSGPRADAPARPHGSLERPARLRRRLVRAVVARAGPIQPVLVPAAQ